MSDLTRQQLCAALGISESTVRRLEQDGMPFTHYAGAKRKTYNLVKCRIWLRKNSPKMAGQSFSNNPRNFYSGNSRAKLLNRTASWADHDAIKAIYQEASRLTFESGIQHHVDHTIPLQGEFVSGLHVQNNLQILTANANSIKKNRYEVDQ